MIINAEGSRKSAPLCIAAKKKEDGMTLSELLTALSSNTNVNITLMDDADNQLITFNAAGYGAVESDLGTRKVKRIKISSGTSVVISVEDAETTEPTTDPTSDPSSDPSDDPSNPSGDPSGDP